MDKVAQKFYCLVAPLVYTGTESKGFTYESPRSLATGQIVKIPLGRRQSLGVVINPNATKPQFATKPITEALDLPPLPPHLVKLAEWMADYYYSSPKAVWQTILPAGLTKKRRALKPSKPLELPAQNEPLTPEQQTAFKKIKSGEKTTYLVHGITGSGKTRLYIELARASLSAGHSVIILIPEISLTPQVIAHFEAVFPGQVIPYHSGLTESQRHHAWSKALETQSGSVVVGPRSALFLPLPKLGLVVIDEEHENTFKQEQNPRYHAIPTAAKLASLAGAKLVLGSATPRLADVFAAQYQKIELLELKTRALGQPLPETVLIDLRDKQNLIPHKFISRPLLDALKGTFSQGRQSLLFMNRRGSASSQICADCGTTTDCPNCFLPATFHADYIRLICHLCNWRGVPPAVCPNCGSGGLRYIGGGTKRIENELAGLIPEARIARLDRDTGTAGMSELYQALHAGEIDILVGTQMIAKGLDLPLLDTVGVINADSLLHLPDFSSGERTFQLLTQVSGRAGRRSEPGKVYIQTYTPEHPVILAAAAQDFWRFAEPELKMREQLGYPPFRFMLKLTNTAPSAEAAALAASKLKAQIERPGISLIGPAPALHERIGGGYTWHLVAKSVRRAPLVEIARSVGEDWKTDLDPVDLL